MNLDLSESELAFQAEARAWLADNVPSEPLPSMDTAEGFAAHQEWEAKLAEARWAVVSWPEEYHGRGASLVEWVIFEEEYYRAGAPGRVSQNGIFLLSPTIFENGTQEQQDRWLPSMATGEQIWAQAWSEPEAGSDLASLRSKAVRDDGAWRLGAQRPEDLVLASVVRPLGLRPLPQRPGVAAAPRTDLLLLPARRRGRDRPPDRAARRRARLRRAVLRRRLRARRRRPRRARPGLVGRDEHGGQRARPVAALPRSLLRDRRAPRGRCGARSARRSSTGTASSTRGSAPRPTGSTPGAPSPGSSTAARSATPARSTRSSGRTSTWPCTRPRSTCSAPAAELRGPWLDGYLFSLSGPIYAGTNEVQRNVIAERILGLPREAGGGAR